MERGGHEGPQGPDIEDDRADDTSSAGANYGRNDRGEAIRC